MFVDQDCGMKKESVPCRRVFQACLFLVKQRGADKVIYSAVVTVGQPLTALFLCWHVITSHVERRCRCGPILTALYLVEQLGADDV